MRSKPSALPEPAPLPEELRSLLVPGRVRTLDDVSDITAAMIRAFAEGDIHPGRSKELRQWTHLLFTSVAAKAPKQETSVNLIAQLISMESPVVEQPSERKIIDIQTTDASSGPSLLTQRMEEDLRMAETSPAAQQAVNRTAVIDIEVLEIE